MISNKRYWFFMLLIILVYVTGMFVTLFENDSAQFAVMAMRMVQENDFLNLFKGPNEYLDKPHMHYWLAALSFKIFGLHDWAYRIPGILSSLLGAYSCYGLGKLLYNKSTGKLAALIFMTAQTIFLSNIDVRTDAVLTGFTIFAIWKLTEYIETKSILAICLGSVGAAIAFSTKGQIAILVLGLPLVCHMAYSKNFKALLNWRVLIALVVFGICIAPMLYAYYHQFDLHPEKVIRGKDHRSGIFFIFWEQSFERLSGDGIGKNSSDYFFFFHTFLWVFLPWTVIGLVAYWNKVKEFVRNKFNRQPNQEFLTLGGITIIFLIISFAQFKLPHYLNVTMPLFAVLTAAYLVNLNKLKKAKAIKIILGVQYFILGIVFIASSLFCFFVFKDKPIYVCIGLLIIAGIILYYCLKREAYYYRIISIAVGSALLLNFVLNTHFYPSLLEYQGGSSMAQKIEKHNIPTDNIYKISSKFSWSLDFYNQKPVNITTIKELKNKHNYWVYCTDADLIKIKESGLSWGKQLTVDQFRITRLQAKFLNPATRKKVLNKMHLIHVY
ncbi:4-amino-4-deoxy-L-arabinose transferase-like glycosyltransferase [Maribacter vaceletii]|uniref:4-amino-4-deoxy-L-arabinose transferase-like glycosyltransferase n=1 Tax=Maribacter vaceletii TaxID=1206816 RepID=A0A495E8Y1_9FLAO|nr:glycosyltransferase family 39 protein [Maribacter vaceletii]RKR12267.1 4-amino-4-deoxy-L-arabinose transferase-like glycosyltransferase [Maribacter vaceletii]